MKKLFIVTISILEILIALGCAFATRIDGPYRGKVIDADSREPIEGMVVLGVWDREYPGAGGAVHEYYDAMETVTDKNGDFEIKGLGLLVMSNVIPMDVLIFKAGYEHIGRGSWKGIKRRGWKGDEESYDPVKNIKMRREVYDPKLKIKWEGDRAIIPLRKLTMEERRKQGTPDFYVGKRYDEKENITHSCLPKNIRLLPKEVNAALSGARRASVSCAWFSL